MFSDGRFREKLQMCSSERYWNGSLRSSTASEHKLKLSSIALALKTASQPKEHL